MFATAAVVAVLALTPGFRDSARLSPIASFVAGKPVTVECGRNKPEWSAYSLANGGTSQTDGLTPFGGDVTHLSPAVCAYLEARLNGRPSDPYWFAASALTIVHESIHARGERDEGITDCTASHELPRVLVRFFKVKSGKDLRTVMGNVARFRAGSAAIFRTVC